MEKRNALHSNSELDEYVEVDFEEEQPVMVRLVLLKDVRLKTIGKYTGIEYFFGGSGSELDVDERDAQFLLGKISASCCTGNTNSPYFSIVR